MPIKLPDLTFPQIEYGATEARWDLRCLVYRGGAATNFRTLAASVASGMLGAPIKCRIPLAIAVHDVLTARLAVGGSRHTTRGTLTVVRLLFAWADKVDATVSIETIQSVYTEWTEHLLTRVRNDSGISARTAVTQAGTVGAVIDEMLELNAGVLRTTRLFRTYGGTRRRRPKAKLNLEHTFAFGHALFDITQSLTVEAIRSPLPIKIRFSGGVELEEWTRLRSPNKVKNLAPDSPDSWEKRFVVTQREAWSADTSLRTRRPLANLRVEAELLIFIAQTGMNMAQAHTLKMGRFSYASHLDGYQVQRRYKNRRRGEVEFEIFSEYRPCFEAYLAWRDEMFGDTSDMLFPISSPHGRARDMPPTLSSIRKRVELVGIPFMPPRELRKTRVNWIKRRSKDDDLTAEMAQHTKATLLSDYDIPDHQVALIEVTRFHEMTVAAMEAPGPVVCEGGSPTPLAPSDTSPEPDCISPAGCLFCAHQRDVNSLDHMWSLATFRYLKSLELTRYKPAAGNEATHPAQEAIERITLKFHRFQAKGAKLSDWIAEAVARVNEGHYHPKWEGFVHLMEFRR